MSVPSLNSATACHSKVSAESFVIEDVNSSRTSFGIIQDSDVSE